MVERIRQLLEIRQLTPTQFADTIGVARPIVSHVLSGRNKPSLEVVQRILTAMPELSMPWLLNGTGTMLAAAGATAMPAVMPTSVAASSAPIIPPTIPSPRAPIPVPAPTKAKDSAPRASSIPKIEREAGNAHKLPAIKRFTASRPGLSTQISADAALAPEQVVAAEAVTTPVETPSIPLQAAPVPLPALPAALEAPMPAASGTAATSAAALLAGAEKAIRRIVIFYRDGSFADFQPE